MSRRLVCALTLLLFGCPQGDDDDSADPETGPIEVLGIGFYDDLLDAVEAAPSGGTILMSPGCYDFWLYIDKPLTIRGTDMLQVVLTGNGAGSAVTIDQAAGAVTLQNLTVYVPWDEPTTQRGVRITDSPQVILDHVQVTFEGEPAAGAAPFCERVYEGGGGDCNRGSIGVELARSTATLNEVDVVCVGFTAESGGTGILAQSDSSLTVLDSSIQGVGSFAIHALDSAVTVQGSEIVSVNRDAGAADGEANGSAILVEETTEPVIVSDTTFSNGVFVGVWAQGTSAEIANSTFTSWAYGVVVTGDTASAAGRRLTVAGSTFEDLYQAGIYAAASSTISTSIFRTTEAVALDGGLPYAGPQLVGAGATMQVAGNTMDRLGLRGVGVYGSNADGNVASATITGNTITGIFAGNGIDAQLVDEAIITDNVVVGADHAADPEGDGGASNGFGIDCFVVDQCTLSGNDVTGAEFGNYVLVQAVVASEDDRSTGGLSRGWHIERSSGRITRPVITDARGFGLLSLDSQLVVEDGVVTGTLRGPSLDAIDNVDDPKTLSYNTGGRAAQSLSLGLPTSLGWYGGSFTNNVDSALMSFDGALEVEDVTCTDNGRDDVIVFEDGSSITYGPGAVLYVTGNDPTAVRGPRIRNNVIDGGGGYYAVDVSAAPLAEIVGNHICAGDGTGLSLRDVPGSTVADNVLGADDALAACAALDWYQAIGLSGQSVEPTDPIVIEGNVLAGPSQDYAVSASGLGAVSLVDNVLGPALTTALNVSASTPGAFFDDLDGDGAYLYVHDCDDTRADRSPYLAEVPGDGVDNDCDGVVDDGQGTADADGDGFTAATGDCDDGDAAVYPGAEEIVDLKDNDCDTWADVDADLPWMAVDVVGSTLSGAGGASLFGGTLRLHGDGAGVQLSGLSGTGISVNTWSLGSVPARSPGRLEVDDGVVFESIGGACLSIGGEGASAALGDVALDGCGAQGLVVSSLATVDAGDLTVDATGVALQVDGTLIAGAVSVAGGSTGLVLSGDAAVDTLDIGGVTTGVTLTGGTLSGAVTVTEPLGNGWSQSAGDASLTALQVDDAALAGALVGGGTLTISGALSVSRATGNGVTVSGGVVDTAGLVVDQAGVDGVAVSGGSFAAQAGSIVSAGAAGLRVTGGATSLGAVTVEGAAEDAVHASGDASLGLDGAILSGSGGFGLVCDGGDAVAELSTVVLDPCAFTAVGNTDGAASQFNGCETYVCTVQ